MPLVLLCILFTEIVCYNEKIGSKRCSRWPPTVGGCPLYPITFLFDDGGIFVRPPQRTVALRQISTGRRLLTAKAKL